MPARVDLTIRRALRDRIQRAAARLLEAYGPQGWWPLRSERHQFTHPQGEPERRGYHPEQFDFPRTRQGRWEMVCGAILTQNTAWNNVERALDALWEAKLLTPESILRVPRLTLATLIRPAGYFNQKSEYLVQIANWFVDRDRALGRTTCSRSAVETVRPELLRVKGVGPETADSVLLYAYRQPTFVVDTYTRRVFGRIGVVQPEFGYERIRSMLEQALGLPNASATVRLWQETHALIVEHAKRCHGKQADPAADFLLEMT